MRESRSETSRAARGGMMATEWCHFNGGRGQEGGWPMEIVVVALVAGIALYWPAGVADKWLWLWCEAPA